MTHATTTRNTSTIIEMFADATPGESYADNRLITEKAESGNVALVAYGWMKLAEYDETEEQITVYMGHKSIESQTVSRWLNKILEQTSERRPVNISDRSPTVRTPNEAVEYVGSYINFEGDKSAVEREAEREVVESLRFLNRFL